jgi:glycosyltransferase involved in cell wall biosynthesis
VALVTPWFGEQSGGAQMLSMQLVHELFALGQSVDVLTTCSRSFDDDWSSNHYEEGATRFDGYTVRRFRVRARDSDVFAIANQFLMGLSPDMLRSRRHAIPARFAAAFCAENIQSPSLLKYLSDWSRSYRAIIFTPYLYGPTLSGVDLAAGRAYLQPCLHDEAYAYLPQVAAAFSSAKGLLFNSNAEYELALRLYGRAIERKSRVVGHWVGAPDYGKRRLGGLKTWRGPFLLYLGRIDRAKGIETIIEAFASYRRYRPQTRLTLVLAGTGINETAATEGVVALGHVSEAVKAALLNGCAALLQPSAHESFSRVVMEAWSYSKPAAVNAKCTATSQAVRASGGGWCAASQSDWIAAMAQIDSAPEGALESLGALGYKYYLQNGTRESVFGRYKEILLGDSSSSSSARQSTTYSTESSGKPA